MRRRSPAVAVPAVDHYERLDWTVGGAAPKDVLRDPATGTIYIAKAGYRLSVLQCLTEYAINIAGRCLGVPVAEGSIATYRGQLRYMSKYFLGAGQELIHGVVLFKELYDDQTIDGILKDKDRERRMFTIQAIKATFGAHYGQEVVDRLFRDFVVMLTHDAILGLQDRHHENWGVVRTMGRDSTPTFAPIFDSASGLFSKYPLSHLRQRFCLPGRHGREALERYCRRSMPLVGWDGEPALNHYALIARLFHAYPRMRRSILDVLARFDWRAFLSAARSAVGGLMQPVRLDLMRNCIRTRVKGIRRAIDSYRGGA